MNKLYHHTQDIHNTRAAKEIVPYLLEIIKPSSVLDVGMGIGTWLKVFNENGIDDYIGVDGDYVDTELFEIPEKHFLSHDLRTELNLHRKFDLAISLEVIEHIPKENEINFLNSLTNHSDNILFSAAIPGQGGQNHHNEQWQSYWAKEFKLRGYTAYDLFRKEFWSNKKIEWWYSQNMILYSKNELNLESYGAINDMIHKELYQKKLEALDNLMIRNHENEIKYRHLIEGRTGIRQPLVLLMNAIKHKFTN